MDKKCSNETHRNTCRVVASPRELLDGKRFKVKQAHWNTPHFRTLQPLTAQAFSIHLVNRVHAPLKLNLGRGSMTGVNDRFGRQREQFALDAGF